MTDTHEADLGVVGDRAERREDREDVVNGLSDEIDDFLHGVLQETDHDIVALLGEYIEGRYVGVAVQEAGEERAGREHGALVGERPGSGPDNRSERAGTGGIKSGHTREGEHIRGLDILIAPRFTETVLKRTRSSSGYTEVLGLDSAIVAVHITRLLRPAGNNIRPLARILLGLAGIPNNIPLVGFLGDNSAGNYIELVDTNITVRGREIERERIRERQAGQFLRNGAIVGDRKRTGPGSNRVGIGIRGIKISARPERQAGIVERECLGTERTAFLISDEAGLIGYDHPGDTEHRSGRVFVRANIDSLRVWLEGP